MKKLKMFAVSLLGMLVMISGVHAATENPCEGEKVYATVGDTSACYTDVAAVLSAMDDEDNVKASIKLYKDLELSAEIEIPTERELTLDLNGNDVTVQKAISVKGTLTIKNSGSASTMATNDTTTLFKVDGGKLSVNGNISLESEKAITADLSSKKALIAVKGNDASESTVVTIGNDVKVNTKGAGLVVYSNKSTDGKPVTGESTGVTINAAGTWVTELYTISIHGQVEEGDESPVINVSEGKFTSNGSIAFYASGYGEWNVTGGEIIGGDAFSLRAGEVVIAGNAKLTGKKIIGEAPTGTSSGDTTGSAFRFDKDNRSPITDEVTVDVKLNGGTFKSDVKGGYAIYFEDIARLTDSSIEITNGLYSSKGDAPAVGFGKDIADAKEFLDNHESMIKGGEFTNAITNGVNVGGASYPSATVAEKLTKGTEFKTENGVVVVGAGNTTVVDPGTQTPGTTDQPGNQGDSNIPPVPQTNDNILVYAGLGLVSLASVAFTTRKREN